MKPVGSRPGATAILAGVILSGAMLSGCATTEPYDYTTFNQHPPRSILVLPPLNHSTTIEGTYGYLSTVSQPLAERGYYVFPVAVVDQLLRENGMPTAYEMHDVSLDKVREVTGADAVLYPTLVEYGSDYYVIGSETTVRVTARLVDTRTGTLLWSGTGFGYESSSSGSLNILLEAIAAAVYQAVSSSTDRAHTVSRTANEQMFTRKDAGLPFGPYHPEFLPVK